MKKKIKKFKVGFGVSILIVVTTVIAVGFLWNRPMVECENNPRIAFISATVGQDGAVYDCDIFESEISDELSDALISLFLNAEMRSTIFPPPQNYTVSDGSVHITIKIVLDNSDNLSMFVNLCTDPQYSSAQFGESHYHIVNHQQLYQDVYDLLSDALATYAVKR